MDPIIGGAAISAGANLLGGLFGRKSNKDAQASNVAMQREFAQNGIQWKVEDAKKAGIHPLYALGANTHSFSPIAVQDSMGPAISNMGQDISRAMLASADRKVQAEAVQAGARLRELQTEGQYLANNNAFQQQLKIAAETELLQLQKRKLERELQNAPGIPSGTGSSSSGSGSVSVEPSKQVSAVRGESSREAFKGLGKPGFIPTRIGGDRIGYTLDVPNNELSEALESMSVVGAILGPLIWGTHVGGLAADRGAASMRSYMERFKRYGTR